MFARICILAILHAAAVAAVARAQLDSRQDTDGTCDFICPEEDNMYWTAYSPDPCSATCSSYFVCLEGVPYQLECPDGLAWDQDLQVCDWPRNAGECPSVPECCSA